MGLLSKLRLTTCVTNTMHKFKKKKLSKLHLLLLKTLPLFAVVAGDGLADIFKSQGVDYVISGGQTMNPSTEDIVKAIEQVNAKNVIILPNNKNIFMAAQSAAEVVDVNAAVVETRTVPQGFTSLLAFDPSQSIEANVEAMTASLSDVTSGSVTLAVRDTTIDGLEIHEMISLVWLMVRSLCLHQIWTKPFLTPLTR